MKLFRLYFIIVFLISSSSVFSSDFFTLGCDSINGFLINKNYSITIFYDSADAEVVKLSAKHLSSDIELVIGKKPKVTTFIDSLSDYTIVVGTLGNNVLINKLAQTASIPSDNIEGKWECYLAKTIDSPYWGGKRALVIAGSDKRGTAYGIFELSKTIGVSPWYWWADVTPRLKESLCICPVDKFSKEPTVKYRGIFINDEDWGLQEWAEYTFDPVRDIGPKTYEKVFELLLRLKANCIWPAMHPCTKAFNYYAENKVVADKYAIIMGSSHHEPLLYNTESWPYSRSSWNAFTNLEGVMGVLEDQVKNNGMYENIYTMGIRGPGDGGMSGASSLDEATAKTEEIIALERDLLVKYVDPNIVKVPQVFWPYKEVLDIYNNNMQLPDDITLGWVDDNHGYIRQVSNPKEQKRSGGSGVYYHISYWGTPADYLWISTTQPALIATEMKKAVDFGGNRIWIFNVGDIKPAEMLTNFCLDLAWDYNAWGPNNVRKYIYEWISYQFEETYAEEITSIYMKYFQLAQAAKPEHINLVNFSEKEIDERLAAYEEIAVKAENIYNSMPSDLSDAFFETVYYPIKGASLMNQKFLYATKSFSADRRKDSKVHEYAQKSSDAHNAIIEITNYYNTGIKDGKWNKIMSCDIRDQSVYDMPEIATDNNYVEYANIDLSTGTFVSPMKYEDELVFGEKLGAQTSETGGKAEFTFEMEEATYAEIYFYAKTPSPQEDSWIISVNGSQVVQNNYATGDHFEWIKVKSQTLIAGTNTLVINQREPNAQIKAIKITNSSLFTVIDNSCQNADTVIPAWNFSIKKGSQGYHWETIEGLSTSEKAVVNLPYTLASVTNAIEAPYIEQNVNLEKNGFTLEVRCMPTHRLYEGRDLRIAISIDGKEPEVISIYHPYPTSEWKKNVLQGYTKVLINHIDNDFKANIKLYALDPVVIFDKILIYYNDSSDHTSMNLKDFNKAMDSEIEIINPNPSNDISCCKLESKYIGNNCYLEPYIKGKLILGNNKLLNNTNCYTFSSADQKKGIYILNVEKNLWNYFSLFEKS